MAFSYDFATNSAIANIRLLIADTDPSCAIFQDDEITAAYNIQASQFQSSQYFSGLCGPQSLPTSPVSYLRVAALLLDALAASKSRLSSITQLLDVKLDPSMAAKALRDQAKNYREIDDDAGAFAIIEQCNNEWAGQQRWWAQIQRQSWGI